MYNVPIYVYIVVLLVLLLFTLLLKLQVEICTSLDYSLKRFVTSTKAEVMRSGRLSVILSVCLYAALCKNLCRDLREIFTKKGRF